MILEKTFLPNGKVRTTDCLINLKKMRRQLLKWVNWKLIQIEICPQRERKIIYSIERIPKNNLKQNLYRKKESRVLRPDKKKLLRVQKKSNLKNSPSRGKNWKKWKSKKSKKSRLKSKLKRFRSKKKIKSATNQISKRNKMLNPQNHLIKSNLENL